MRNEKKKLYAPNGTVKDPEKEPAKNAVQGRGHGGAMAKGPHLGADLLNQDPGAKPHGPNRPKNGQEVSRKDANKTKEWRESGLRERRSR